jgi:hypothetical protein
VETEKLVAHCEQKLGEEHWRQLPTLH